MNGTRLQTSARALLNYLSPRQPAIDTAIDTAPTAGPDPVPTEIAIPIGLLNLASTPEASIYNDLSAASPTSTASTSSSKVLLRELIDREVAHARELDARDRELHLLQQELAGARTPQPPVSLPAPTRHAPTHTPDLHTATLPSLNLLPSTEFYTTVKNWTPLSDVSEEAFKTWQAQILAIIAGDKDLHPLIVSESGKLDRLIRHTTDTSRNRAIYTRLAPCILAATAAPYIKRNGIAGKGIELFYLLDSVFIDRSPAAKQRRITTFLTSIQRSPTEPIDAYYNRYSTLLHRCVLQSILHPPCRHR